MAILYICVCTRWDINTHTVTTVCFVWGVCDDSCRGLLCLRTEKCQFETEKCQLRTEKCCVRALQPGWPTRELPLPAKGYTLPDIILYIIFISLTRARQQRDTLPCEMRRMHTVCVLQGGVSVFMHTPLPVRYAVHPQSVSHREGFPLRRRLDIPRRNRPGSGALRPLPVLRQARE